MKSNAKGIKRIIKAFGYSFDGFTATFKSEAAFRQDIAFCIVAFVASLFLPVTVVQWLLMVGALFLILLMELVNTAIEALVDRISDDFHILSKKAKDIGSLLVLLVFVYTFVVWGGILYSVY